MWGAVVSGKPACSIHTLRGALGFYRSDDPPTPIMFEALRPKPRVSMRVKNFPLMDMRLFSVLLFALFMAS